MTFTKIETKEAFDCCDSTTMFVFCHVAKNIIDHEHVLTPEVVQLSMLYGYVEEYFDDIKLLIKFYNEVKDYSSDLRYGDLGFFRELLANNYDKFIAITDKMESVNNLDDIEIYTATLFEFIESTFANTHIRIDFLEYSQSFHYYVERIKVHKDVLQKLSLNK